MKGEKIKLYSVIFAGTLGSFFTSCIDENLYNPNYVPGLRPENEYFDFSMRNEIQLKLNYGEIGAFSVYEVYDQFPMKEVDGMMVKNKDLKPVFAGFLNKDGKIECQFPVASVLTKLYLCTSSPFLPECVEMDVKDGQIIYSNVAEQNKVKAKKADELATLEFPFGLVESPVKTQLTDKNLTTFYALTDFNLYGKSTTPGFMRQVAESQEMTDLYKRISTALPKNRNNSHLAQPASVVNINVNNRENPEKGTNITLTFVAETASFSNTVGYYYYKTGTTPDLNTIPKYLLIPSASDSNSSPFSGGANSLAKELAPIQRGATCSLQFFGDNYDQAATYDFPSGYTIGWVVVCNGFDTSKGTITYKSYETARVIYSNQEKNGLCRFLTLYDATSKKLVVGFEDGGSGEDYSDVLFYVDANPIKAITNPEIPSITTDEYAETEYDYSGTYAFEDIWPSGGDYDMNDVVVEYSTKVVKAVKRIFETTTVNGKPVTNLVDQKEYIDRFSTNFDFVHDGADFRNAFGVQLDGMNKSDIEKVSLDSAIINWETGNQWPSVIVCPDARQAKLEGKKFLWNVKFVPEVVKPSVAIQKLFNPFIVINNNGSASNRKEVHLPKFKTTSLGFSDLNINQYYVDGTTGTHSFAFDIPVHNYNVVTERVTIDEEYPNFKLWVESNGKQHTNWFATKAK